MSLRELQRQVRTAKTTTGPEGPEGPEGEAGSSGSVISFGTEDPITPVGEDRDVYLQKDADSVVLKTYQKSAGAWAETGEINPAWTDYTPTVTSVTGTLTSASGVGRYLQLGRTIFVAIALTIFINGTGATGIQATLPVIFPYSPFSLAGAEVNVGKMLMAVGTSGVASVTIYNYDLTYPGFDNANLIVSGTYEANI